MKILNALFLLEKKIAVANSGLPSIGRNGIPSDFYNAEIVICKNYSVQLRMLNTLSREAKSGQFDLLKFLASSLINSHN